MRVVVTAANGAVGRAILRANAASDVVAVVRSERAAVALRPLAGAARIVQAPYDDGARFEAALGGATAVVHLAGILVERPDSTYEDANVETTRRVTEAARRRGVAKPRF